ncbi:MAG: tetratricopeptide repeat protein [Elusimicrobiaceae bacterium]
MLRRVLFSGGILLIALGFAALAAFRFFPIGRPPLGKGMAAARLYLKKRNYAAAIKTCDILAKAYPNNGEVYLLRGSANLRTGNFARSNADFDRAAQFKNTALNAWLWKSFSCAFERKWAEQERAASKALEINPSAKDAYVLRAVARTQLKSFADAKADYAKALELKPADAGVMLKKAQLEFDSGDFNSSRDDALKALALDATRPEAYALVGKLYLKAGDSVNARKYFELAVKKSNGSQKYAQLLKQAPTRKKNGK